MAEGVNLPVVLQQTGYVTKVQESVGRAGEHEQDNAQAQAVREDKRRRQSVQKSEESDGENRVRSDEKGSGGQKRQASGRRGKGRSAPDEDGGERGGGGLVDVVV